MDHVGRGRLVLLRALYLLIAVGLGYYLWPDLVDPKVRWGVLEGQTQCMLAAFSLLCLVGLRYPLRMLPILLWELLWKAMWCLLVPLPLALSGHFDPKLAPVVFAVGLGVVLVPIAIPWRHLLDRYVRAGSESWR